ncbi:hypothetical protein LTR48_007233, partial [Friedmanniomyces endolithicus]
MDYATSIRESTKTADIFVSAVQIPDESTTADESVAETPNTPRRDFESSALYIGVYDYVKQYMSRYDPSHDFNHVLRVLALAKHILAEDL